MVFEHITYAKLTYLFKISVLVIGIKAFFFPYLESLKYLYLETWNIIDIWYSMESFVNIFSYEYKS